MAVFNPCIPCDGCVPGYLDQDAYHQAVINALCLIAGAVVGTDSVNIAQYGGVATSLGQKAMASSIPVTLASDQTWTGATNLGKSEDAAHTTGDVGVMALGVANQQLGAALVGNNNDYCPIATNVNGAVYTHLWYDNSQYSAVKLEDAAHSTGDAGVMALGVNNRSLATFNTTQLDYTPMGMGDYGNQLTSLLYDAALGNQSPIVKEDNAHTSGDPGVFVLAVRNQNRATLSGTELDYTPFGVSSYGGQYIEYNGTWQAGAITQYPCRQSGDAAASNAGYGMLAGAARVDAPTSDVATGGYRHLKSD